MPRQTMSESLNRDGTTVFAFKGKSGDVRQCNSRDIDSVDHGLRHIIRLTFMTVLSN